MVGSQQRDVLWVQYPNVDYYPPGINALRAMSAHGFGVDVLCAADWPATGVRYPETVNVRRMPSKPPRGWRAPLFFSQFLHRAFQRARVVKPRILIGADLQGIVVAGLIGEALKIPYLYYCYDLYLPSEGMGTFDRRLKRLEKLFAQRAAGLVFPSESKAQLFFRTSGVSQEYIVVANAPSRQPEAPSQKLQKAIRSQGGDPQHVVLYQGSIGPASGVDMLIRSIPFWPDGTVLALLGIVRPTGFLDHLLDLAKKFDVADRVFYLGMIGYDHLLDFTRSADVGTFLPTKTQSNYVYSGTAVNKIMEYMASGVPSLVASFPELETLMTETGAGVTVDPTDAEAIGLSVHKLLSNRVIWKQYSQAGRRAHLEKYHFGRQFAPVLELICRLRDQPCTIGRRRQLPHRIHSPSLGQTTRRWRQESREQSPVAVAINRRTDSCASPTEEL